MINNIVTYLKQYIYIAEIKLMNCSNNSESLCLLNHMGVLDRLF